MKLRTEMVDFHGRVLPRNGTHVAHFALEHDAAAAHALMQAMDEFGGENTPDCYIDKHWVRCLRKRADSILAEWGFDSGEDA